MSREQYNDLGIENHSRGKKKSKLMTVLLIILFILVGFSLFLYFTNDKEPKQKENIVEPIKVKKIEKIQEKQKKETPIKEVTEEKKEVEYVNKEEKIIFDKYIIKEGDTINSIAKEHNIKPITILALNKFIATKKIKAGEILTLSNVDGIIYISKVDDELPTLIKQFSPQLSLEKYLELTQRESTNIIEGESLFFPSPIKKNIENLNLSKPCSGKIKTLFGQVINGIPVDYIIIELDEGKNEVINSLSGIVKDINYIANIGKSVIISSDDYIITYGNLKRMNIDIGQEINEKEEIGTAQSTLYYKVEVNGIPINPEQLFKED